jgi:hypothetical protein
LCANVIVDDGDQATIMKVMMTVTGTGTIERWGVERQSRLKSQ